jgi:hypothetical protein
MPVTAESSHRNVHASSGRLNECIPPRLSWGTFGLASLKMPSNFVSKPSALERC